ncbi:MAG: hypothetical protein LWY06_19110 [Firmicutes bacterium]|nr:hypothetical protein [Bacillota bacterium]
MYKKHFVILLLFSFILNFAGAAFASPSTQSKKQAKPADSQSAEKMKKMQKQIDDLQSELLKMKDEMEKMKAEKQANQEKTVPQPETSPSPSESPAPDNDQQELEKLQKEMQTDDEDSKESEKAKPQGGSSLNPDISVIGDFVWNLNHNKDIDGGNPFQLRELEIGIQGNIDPWTSMAAFVSVAPGSVNSKSSKNLIYKRVKTATSKHGDEESGTSIDLEECYTNFHKLPLGLQMKAGKFLMNFGKDNLLHPHAKPYVDIPTVVNNYLGEEGMAGTGASLSAMIPLGRAYGEITAEAVNDENETTFSGGTSGKVLYNGHAKLFTDLSESSNIEAGYSYMTGFNNEDATRLSKLQGVDLTYRWRPLQRGRYNSVLVRGEHFWSSRENTEGRYINTKGYYGFAQYQLNRNWYIGTRYDYSEYPYTSKLHEKSISGILTYYPTEFSYMRLQYKSTDSNYATPLYQWLFQLNFMVGPHGAHKF